MKTSFADKKSNSHPATNAAIIPKNPAILFRFPKYQPLSSVTISFIKETQTGATNAPDKTRRM